MKVFIIDQARCSGCYNCQLACKDEHVGNDWSPYAKPQPEVGHFWIKVNETTHGQTPKVRVEYKPTMCNHCDDAPCAAAYPDAFEKRADGLVILKPDAAGDAGIVDACPYGAIYWNDELAIAQKCTGCAHLVDEGQVPHCVDLCTIGGLRFGEEADFADEIAAATTVADPAHGPRVYYLNAPGLFISGEVWDPATDEIIEGARVTLSGDAEAEALSDDFGDFWFRGLEPGTYSLRIEAEGYRPAVRDGIELTESLNVGDFGLEA